MGKVKKKIKKFLDMWFEGCEDEGERIGYWFILITLVGAVLLIIFMGIQSLIFKMRFVWGWFG